MLYRWMLPLHILLPLIAAYWQKRKVLNTVLSEICNGWATCFHCNWPNPTQNSLSCWRRLNVQDWCKLWWRRNPVLGGCTAYFAHCVWMLSDEDSVCGGCTTYFAHCVWTLSDENSVCGGCTTYFAQCMDVDYLMKTDKSPICGGCATHFTHCVWMSIIWWGQCLWRWCNLFYTLCTDVGYLMRTGSSPAFGGCGTCFAQCVLTLGWLAKWWWQQLWSGGCVICTMCIDVRLISYVMMTAALFVEDMWLILCTVCGCWLCGDHSD